MEILRQLYQQAEGEEGEKQREKMGHFGRGFIREPGAVVLRPFYFQSSLLFLFPFFSSCFHSCLSWESDFSLAFLTSSKARNKQVSGCPCVTRHPLADISRLALYLTRGRAKGGGCCSLLSRTDETPGEKVPV